MMRRTSGARWKCEGPFGLLLVIVIALTSNCTGSEVRRYELTGQVVAVNPPQSQITIAHDAIPGYMPAMTMPFKVKGVASLGEIKPGDLVRAGLVITREDGFIERLKTTGHRDVSSAALVPAANPVDYLLEGDRVPNLGLVDQDNNRRRLFDKSRVATVLTFTYTRCPFPTFCPLMDRNFAALQKLVAQNPQLSGNVRLLSVTIDPSFDTPDVLRAHAERVKADPGTWVFVAPEEEVPGTLAARFGVTASVDPANPAIIVHNLATVVLDRSGVVVRIFRGNDWKPEEVHDLLVHTQR